MSQIHLTAELALTAAHELSNITGRQVHRHCIIDKFDNVRWLITFEENLGAALELLPWRDCWTSAPNCDRVATLS